MLDDILKGPCSDRPTAGSPSRRRTYPWVTLKERFDKNADGEITREETALGELPFAPARSRTATATLTRTGPRLQAKVAMSYSPANFVFG